MDPQMDPQLGQTLVHPTSSFQAVGSLSYGALRVYYKQIMCGHVHCY